MDVNNNGRWRAYLPFLCSVVLVAGMVLGFNLRDTLRGKRDITTVIQRNDRLDEIIDLVTERYVDTVNSNLLYKDAVSGILKSLDPHTVYIPADDVEAVNDDLEGGFSGIGVEFAIVRDTIQVTAVIDKGPAGNAGLDIGDQMIRVGDSLVAGVNITGERISHMLKGKQKTNVAVTVRRPGGLMKTMTITRDLIATYSVDASIMLDGRTGYIKINRFSATTAEEFKTALKKLLASGATQLVVDLRDNPGGYLDVVTVIADNFLDDGKLVVYTQGVHTPKTEYRSKEKGLFEQGRLAILVDENSASASEILAGAMQDWDRGIIVGRRTFGKGLVQEQYDLEDGAALRLTIARYYTPSGRCIQRSFAGGKEAYMEDYEKRFEDGDLTGNDTQAVADTTRYFTAGHRVVYGGGGIKPDVYVPYDTSLLSAPFQAMLYSPELKTVIWDYFITNRAQMKYKDITDFDRSFNSSAIIVRNYLSALDANARKTAETQLAKPVNSAYLSQQVKARVARFLFRDNGYYAINVQHDDVINKTLDVLNSGQYLKLVSGK